MKKEEIENIIKSYNQRLSFGSSLSLIDFENNTLKLKFVCSDKTEFLVQGKKVTFADELKKEAEKYLKSKISNIKIIFI